MPPPKSSEKHLPYYTLRDALRESAERAECALCSLERERLRRYLGTVLDEQVNDPQVRTELVRAHGYCPRHAHLLLGFGDALGTTILYLDQVRAFRTQLEALQEGGGPGKPRLRRQAKQWTAHEACPACRYLRDHRRRLLDVLADGLREPEMREALEAAAPLCVPHFYAVMEILGDARLRRFLGRTQNEKLTRLENELAEFYRKQDYRYRHEPVDCERDAWLRAVAVMAGDPDLSGIS